MIGLSCLVFIFSLCFDPLVISFHAFIISIGLVWLSFGHVCVLRVVLYGCSLELFCAFRMISFLGFITRFVKFLYAILVTLSLEMSFGSS